MAEAEKQVKVAGQNQLVDYKELHRYKNENEQLRQYIHDITEENGKLNETLCGLLDVLAIPDFREMFFAIADALIGGRPIPTSSDGGGDTSDLRWDGRNPDEDEQSYRRRCMIAEYMERMRFYISHSNEAITISLSFTPSLNFAKTMRKQTVSVRGIW